MQAINADKPTPPRPTIHILSFFLGLTSFKIIPAPVGTAHPKITDFFKGNPLGILKHLFSDITEKLLKVVIGPAFIVFFCCFGCWNRGHEKLVPISICSSLGTSKNQ